jgi:hypothetical protein
MNDSRSPIIDPYRTLRRSFVVICDGHLPSALLLDYIVTVEHALDEARGQGERFGQWRALSLSHVSRVLQYDPSKHTVITALQKLERLGFIESHPNNADNRGGYARTSQNWYRLCTTQVLNALAEYRAVQNETASADAVQNVPPVVVKFEQQTRAEIDRNAVQISTQESLEESHSDLHLDSSSSTARMRTMSLSEIESLWHSFAGKTPTPEQREAMLQLLGQYGADALTQATRTAQARGGKSYQYIRRILENPIPDKVLPPPAAPAAPAEDRGVRLTLEEADALLRAGRG